MRKTILSILSIAMIFTLFVTFSGSVFALSWDLTSAQPSFIEFDESTSHTEMDANDFEDMIAALEKYVSFQNNQITFDRVPAHLINRYGQDTITSLQQGVEHLNKLAYRRDIIITDNGTIYDVTDDQFVIQGGSTKTTYHWWGFKNYMSTSRANNAASAYRSVGSTAQAVSMATAYMGAANVALLSGLTSWYMNGLGNNIANRNSGHSRGIILNMTWAAAYTTARQ